jgi:hypothetical protein
MIAMATCWFLSVMVVATGGWYIVRMFAEPLLTDEIAAAAINTLGCWIAFMPVVAARHRHEAVLAKTVLATMRLRMMLVILGALFWMFLGFGWHKDFLLWVALFYLATLAVETAFVVRWIQLGQRAPTKSAET